MRILLSGSHGLIGTALISFLADHGHHVVRLSREKLPSDGESIIWDPIAKIVPSSLFKLMDFELYPNEPVKLLDVSSFIRVPTMVQVSVEVSSHTPTYLSPELLPATLVPSDVIDKPVPNLALSESPSILLDNTQSSFEYWHQ